MNYSDLRDIQKRETESSALVTLPEDFYKTMAIFLNTKKQEAINSKSILSIKEYENIRKIIVGIQSKREEKLVLMAIRSDFIPDGLTFEEKQLIKELSLIISKAREGIRSSWDNENSVTDGSIKVRLTADVSQYKGVDDVVYGPFKSGSETTLPKSEAEWLLKAKMAEIV